MPPLLCPYMHTRAAGRGRPRRTYRDREAPRRGRSDGMAGRSRLAGRAGRHGPDGGPSGFATPVRLGTRRHGAFDPVSVTRRFSYFSVARTPTKGTTSRASCIRSAPRSPPAPTRRAHQRRGGRKPRGDERRAARPHQRPPQPHRKVAARRGAVREPSSTPTAPGCGPSPARSTRPLPRACTRDCRPALRDARGDPHAPHPGGRHGGDVDRARDHRGPPRSRRSSASPS